MCDRVFFLFVCLFQLPHHMGIHMLSCGGGGGEGGGGAMWRGNNKRGKKGRKKE